MKMALELRLEKGAARVRSEMADRESPATCPPLAFVAAAPHPPPNQPTRAGSGAEAPRSVPAGRPATCHQPRNRIACTTLEVRVPLKRRDAASDTWLIASRVFLVPGRRDGIQPSR
jgi:hypothetical protein